MINESDVICMIICSIKCEHNFYSYVNKTLSHHIQAMDYREKLALRTNWTEHVRIQPLCIKISLCKTFGMGELQTISSGVA